ncbi:hypothetical protein K3495_g11187 [Podosphaera aphanis]|nr:hypothetical protein K3495_g11187 [Podosphaera aphanis]
MSICWQRAAKSFGLQYLSRQNSRVALLQECLPRLVSSQPSTRFLFPIRHSSSTSSTRWTQRQSKDPYAREAKVRGLKSRAAFKLLEIDSKYNIFKKGQTVVDLGYAPGSWSQIAVERTKPNGRVIGIDIIPAQPPKGASSIQGDFLSPCVQAEVKRFLSDPDRGRVKRPLFVTGAEKLDASDLTTDQSYIDLEQQTDKELDTAVIEQKCEPYRVVDIVLSDMSEPWEQTNGFWKKTYSDPYFRMKTFSGIDFKDHLGSMDLCNAALQFASESLRVGGHFVCKYLQGAEDKEFEKKLKSIFTYVHRDKPQSSRSESKEGFFVALRRKKSDEIATSYRSRQTLRTSLFVH